MSVRSIAPVFTLALATAPMAWLVQKAPLYDAAATASCFRHLPSYRHPPPSNGTRFTVDIDGPTRMRGYGAPARNAIHVFLSIWPHGNSLVGIGEADLVFFKDKLDAGAYFRREWYLAARTATPADYLQRRSNVVVIWKVPASSANMKLAAGCLRR